jgi:hypothetical protein
VSTAVRATNIIASPIRLADRNSGYDWDEGEYEALVADPNATALNYAVGVVEFEGRYFVDGCDCWHDRARKIIGFLINHDEAIALFLTLEKERKRREADRSPVVETWPWAAG